MNCTLKFIIALTLMLLLNSAAGAEPEIKTSGQIRVRFEFDGDFPKNFEKEDATVNQSLMRTRFNIDAEINENVNTFIQFQDSRRFGEPTSGNLEDNESVDLHQAYLRLDHLWKNGIGVKAGRFEVNLGNQRVFGAVGWNNVGRVWDGIQFFHNINGYEFTAYWLRPRDDFTVADNTDFDIFGINAILNPGNLEVFAFLEKDAREPSPAYDFEALKRINMGIYYYRKHDQFDFIWNIVYQTGNQFYAGLTDKEDISAFLFTFEAGYSFDSPSRPQLAFGLDYASGDDDLTDNKCKTYDNLYYTGHKFRGFMDYFIASDDAGLVDIMLRGKINPVEGWTLKGDFHIFTTAADYIYNGEETNDVGIEFDLTVSTSRIRGVEFAAGSSVFMPDKSYAGYKSSGAVDDPENSFWNYVMMTVDF